MPVYVSNIRIKTNKQKNPLTGKLSNKMKKKKKERREREKTKEMRSPNTQGKENLTGENERESPMQ